MNLKKTLAASWAIALLAGCGSSSGGSAAATSASTTDGTTSADDSTVVVAIKADLNTMDHHVATDVGSFIMQSMCIGGLAALDSDAQAIPDLAESWDISDDGLVYTFHIRDGVNWSNGTPVTANDFVYGWKRLDDPDLASEYAFILETIGVKNAGPAYRGEVSMDELVFGTVRPRSDRKNEWVQISADLNLYEREVIIKTAAAVKKILRMYETIR